MAFLENPSFSVCSFQGFYHTVFLSHVKKKKKRVEHWRIIQFAVFPHSRLTAGHHPHLRQHDLNDNAAMKKLDVGMESQAADLTAHEKKQRR